MTLPVSIIVLTKNEEANLPILAASIPWCDDVHVVDSLSNDGTVAKAQELGFRTWSNPFHGFGEQRNWALNHCELLHPWVLFLDADETGTPAFAEALAAAIADAPESVAGFYCCWKMIVDGVWLRRCDAFPKWQFRLLRRGRAHFANFGHGQRETDVQGEIRRLSEPYEHRPVSKGWDEWRARHERYAELEAQERVDLRFRPSAIFEPPGPERNRALKGVVSRIPGWPLVRFAVPYFLQLGFLEGPAGFRYCAELARYEARIQTRMREIKSARAATKA
jgi:glycosyltransferase involved in cell wall biosynthesis